MAYSDMRTAEVVAATDPSWCLTMIYQALLRAGRALLLAHGVLPADGGQHKTVVELVGQILGEEFSVPVSAFERMRKRETSSSTIRLSQARKRKLKTHSELPEKSSGELRKYSRKRIHN